MTMMALSTKAALQVCSANVPRPDLFVHENGAWTVESADPVPSHVVSTRPPICSSNIKATNFVALSTVTARQLCDTNTFSPKVVIHENGGWTEKEHESASFVSEVSESWTSLSSVASH